MLDKLTKLEIQSFESSSVNDGDVTYLTYKCVVCNHSISIGSVKGKIYKTEEDFDDEALEVLRKLKSEVKERYAKHTKHIFEFKPEYEGSKSGDVATIGMKCPDCKMDIEHRVKTDDNSEYEWLDYDGLSSEYGFECPECDFYIELEVEGDTWMEYSINALVHKEKNETLENEDTRLYWNGDEENDK